MKNKLLSLALLSFCLSLHAANFLQPTNPVPQVMLAWTLSPDPTVSNYYVYYGVASGQYTNKLQFGNATNATFMLPARGVTYFFAVTAFAVSSGLESAFSNEVSWTPKAPPGAPTVGTPITLAVQTKAASDSQWADLFSLPLPTDPANQEYRTKLTLVATAAAQVTPQVRALRAVAFPPPPK